MTDTSIASNIDLAEEAEETESHIVIEDGNWDHEMTNADEESGNHIETLQSPEKGASDDMTGVESEFHLEAYSKDEEDNTETVGGTQAPIRDDFFDESDEESDDEYETVNLKNPNALVNILGKKMTSDDVAFAADMKQQMKDFFKKCSPGLSFATLVQLFVQRIPQHNPTYVLSHDERPAQLLPQHKYAILCSAMDCSNAYYRDGSDWEAIEQKKNFFGFPPNQEKCKQWIQSLGRLKYLNKTLNEMQMYRVCEDHFTPDDFTNEYREELLESAVPSLLLGRIEDMAFDNFDE